ncbi:hypothetical protein AV540_08335 [Brevibacillus parabrevis]|nr:hypothetical protein AV540_08335 [Brevibacillus parabrevis]
MIEKEDFVCGFVRTVAEITVCLFTTSSWTGCFAFLPIAAGSWRKTLFQITPATGIIWICSKKSECAGKGLLALFVCKQGENKARDGEEESRTESQGSIRWKTGQL